MSRLKRQRLTVDGQDQVTAATDEGHVRDRQGSQDVANEQRTKQQQGRSLFVRSLPHDATSESLTSFFSQSFPLKHATVVVDSESKQSKGYGFVTFADVEDAQSAKDRLHGSLFGGSRIKVELAEPRHRQPNKGGLIRASKAKTRAEPQKPEFQPAAKLIVRNLPWTIKEPEHLAVLFRSYGKVKHAILPRKKAGLSAGFGFVILRGRRNAERALEGVNGKEVDGRTLAVDWAVEKDVWETLQNGSKETEIIDAPTLRENEESIGSVYGCQIETEDNTHHDECSTSSDTEDSQSKSHEDEDLVARVTDNGTSTLFIRNLPFTSTDEILRDHFELFGPVRYARVVLDHATDRSRGTGFICFYNQADANSCLREAPRIQHTLGQGSTGIRGTSNNSIKQSLLEDTGLDGSGRYTIEGRVLQLSRAVDRNEAARLTIASGNIRDARDKDRRRLFLLSEGTVPSNTPLYEQLSSSEIKMRDDSAKQRQSLIRSNPTLHLSLTRLSIRNLPRSIISKELKALAREAVVGFAKDVKNGLRKQLSKEELARGGEEMRQAEKSRKAKGKGIVKQAKIVFEGREGSKVTEDSGAGRSRGYGFIEYSSHRWALMGLRWLNGHAVEPTRTANGMEDKGRRKRLIAEFAIENAQVVGRRHDRERKARERSRFVSVKLEKGEIPNVISKSLTKDQLMAKTRKDMKRRRSSKSESPVQKPPHGDLGVKGMTDDSKKLMKRQHIIGRKRMMRRSRSQAVSS